MRRLGGFGFIAFPSVGKGPADQPITEDGSRVNGEKRLFAIDSAFSVT